MTCQQPSPTYLPQENRGILTAVSRNDGKTIAIDWNKAYPDSINYTLVYNIYYSTDVRYVFSENPKYVYISDKLTVDIPDFIPGDTYYFAVRAAEYEKSLYNLDFLPDGPNNLKVYPEGALLSPLTETSTSIHVSDAAQFPPTGVVQIGYELIHYTSRDLVDNLLILSSAFDRGYYNTTVSTHTTDGYDGYMYHDPFVRFWKGFEDNNSNVALETSSFFDRLPYTVTDGYRHVVQETLTSDAVGSDLPQDNVTTDLSASDASQQNFESYDYAGWHRTDPVALLRGDCLDTYFGGERFCADGYGVGAMVRGTSINEESHRRLEMLLSITGEPVVLVKRMYKGVTCSCFNPSNEQPQLRCTRCFGTGFVVGYEQYFNPRRSDRRILARFDVADDDIRMDEDGLESVLQTSAWTLVVPAIHDRDFLIRFNEDGTEEYRYKVLSVNRNRLLESVSGSQKLKLQRVRRTDPIYQFKTFDNASEMPEKISTSIGFTMINGVMTPHTHQVTINEGIVNLNQINQVTSVAAGHNHRVVNGVVVSEDLDHTHTLIL